MRSWFALVSLAPLLVGCASRSANPVVGQRVELPYRSIVSADRPSGRRAITGELVRHAADTVCIRERPEEDARCFGTRRGTRPSARPPTHVSDPWLVGDLARVEVRRNGRSRWAAAAWSGDVLVLAGDEAGPLPVVEGARYVGASAQRQVNRARPAGKLVLGGVFLAGGLAWMSHIAGGDPEPLGQIGTGDFVVPALAFSTALAGAIAMVTAPVPYLGWDDVDVSALPPIRVGPGGGQLPQAGVAVTVRFR